MDGILPLWKPKGMTSHDCVMKVRKLFSMKKVGHTGTLDPEVEGVLPICLGQATKIVPFLTDTTKTYVTKILLGVSTDTEDGTGKVMKQKEVTSMPCAEEVQNVLHSFTGQIVQIPPMYSAVKVNGKKLYEYARNNEEVVRPKREIMIHNIKCLSIQSNQPIIQLEIVCSKGTYIRTLCKDIGQALGYPAHMHHLIRTATGSFDKKDTHTFDTIEEAKQNNKQNDLLLPISRGVAHLNQWAVDQNIKKRVQQGQKLPRPDQITSPEPIAVMHGEQLLAVYHIHPKEPNQIKPIRVFNS